MLAELERLQQKYPDIREIKDMLFRWRRWINENSAALLQGAQMYASKSGFDNMVGYMSDLESLSKAMRERVGIAEKAFASFYREHMVDPAVPAKARTRKKKSSEAK